MRTIFLATAAGLLPLAAAPAFADCNAELAAAILRHVSAGPFRVDTATIVDGKPVTTIVEVVRPDRFAFHGVAFLGANGPVRDGPIIIGREMWVKEDSGWVKMAAEVKPGERNALYTDLAERHDTAVDRTCGGRVEREGKEHDIYGFTATHWIGSWRVVTATTLYVDAATGLPAAEEMTAGWAELPDQPKQRVTLTYTYDAGIRIEPPE